MKCFTKRKILEVCWLCAFSPLILLWSSGCFLSLLVGDSSEVVLLVGEILDADTLEPATDVAIGVRTVRDGRVVEERSPRRLSGELSFPPPDADGHFSIVAESEIRPAPTTRSFPAPDRITLTVVRGTCTEEIVIDITDVSVVRSAVIEQGQRVETLALTEPVLVSPCAE